MNECIPCQQRQQRLLAFVNQHPYMILAAVLAVLAIPALYPRRQHR